MLRLFLYQKIDSGRLSLMGLLFCLFINSSVLAESENTITILSEDSYPLNYYDTDTKQFQGYSASLVKAIMEEADLKYEIQLKPWARALREAIQTKNTLIYSVGRIPEREENLLWLCEIISVNNHIFGLAKHRAAASLQDLKNSRIAVVYNSLNYNSLKKNNFTNIVLVQNYEQIYEMLKRDRIDYFTSSLIGLQQFIELNKLDHSEIMTVMDIKDNNPKLYLAANPETDQQIIDKIQAAFQRIKDNGIYNKILEPLLKQQSLVHAESLF